MNRNFERLEPLTGKNSEIGIKADLFGDKALLSAAYFRETENLAVGDGDAENPSTGVLEPVYRAAEGITKVWSLSSRANFSRVCKVKCRQPCLMLMVINWLRITRLKRCSEHR